MEVGITIFENLILILLLNLQWVSIIVTILKIVSCDTYCKFNFNNIHLPKVKIIHKLTFIILYTPRVSTTDHWLSFNNECH
jgi:hypothetical protein